jgi:hypothetical protein
MATIKIKSKVEAMTWNQSWRFACWCDGGRREFGLPARAEIRVHDRQACCTLNDFAAYWEKSGQKVVRKGINAKQNNVQNKMKKTFTKGE